VPNLGSCAKVARQSRPVPPSAQRLLDSDLPCLTAGPALNLSQLGGKVTVVNLWATWCAPCREEMPLLQAASKRYGERVQFIGVNTKDKASWAGEFLGLMGVTYPEVVDTEGQLLGFLRSPGLPVTVVLAADGRIAGKQIGRIREQKLTDLVNEAAG
jgi:thiol-disulfide isomerase/thioredoxin